MSENSGVFYSLQEVRKISNIPLSVFGMKMSEIELIFLKILPLSFVIGVIAQVGVIVLEIPGEPMILYYALVIVPIAMYGVKKLNAKYGMGLVFFFIASYQFKDKLILKSKSVLKHFKK